MQTDSPGPEVLLLLIRGAHDRLLDASLSQETGFLRHRAAPEGTALVGHSQRTIALLAPAMDSHVLVMLEAPEAVPPKQTRGTQAEEKVVLRCMTAGQ